MPSLTDTYENGVLNHIFNGTPLSVPTNIYVGLFTVAPTESTNGTEVSTGGYARQLVTFNPATTGAVTNSNEILFTANGASFGTVVASGLFDAETGGNLIGFNPVTSRIIEDGDSIRFIVDSISVSLD